MLRNLAALKARVVVSLITVLFAQALEQRVSAQALPLEMRQQSTTHNLQSYRGVPIARIVGDPPGSDGRAPDPNEPNQSPTAPAPNQFQNFISFGGTAVPGITTNLNTNLTYIANADGIDLPRGRDDSGTLRIIFKSALAGAPFLSRQVSFLFGSIIPVPDTDADGHPFPPRTSKEDYWLAEPYTTNSHNNSGYYWSKHRRAVFAIQPGPITVTWRKAGPENKQPEGVEGVDWIKPDNFYYRLFPARHIVSGSAAKKPRKMYWTQGSLGQLGKPITVPPARVTAIEVIYNNNFPSRVDKEVINEVPMAETNRFEETRTLWYDRSLGHIYAHNIEGRVLVELLGDVRPDGVSQVHLGSEIVDVSRHPNPDDITVELGERLNAWPDGRGDSDLFPDVIIQGGPTAFTYSHPLKDDKVDLFASRETTNLNDVLVHWLETGEVGLRWPSRLVRYKQVWPADVAKYSHYVRPLVTRKLEAKNTAVRLPLNSAPFIAYEDLLDGSRATLEGLDFYTFLDVTQPVHRTLLRLHAGSEVAFERVFSWLDVNLKSGNFAATIATNLAAWNTNSMRMSFPDGATAPRLVYATASVGQRINPPAGELGELGGDQYWAGHIVKGTSYNPNAYLDPFQAGFAAANLGAIIPVNAIPGTNPLEVHWFRRNQADESRGFGFIHWPSVLGQYALQWPDNASEIILASNDGSGGLSSLQATGRIYYENSGTATGYNPNEEHALMIGGQAYALRDDLNITSHQNYSSDPFVLLEYTEADHRPAMRAFKVLREKPEAGIVFDYVTEAGQKLQAPMPLPLMAKPLEGAGPSAKNYNTEPFAMNGDVPAGWDASTHTNGPYGHYNKFVYRDRKEEFWVYRGIHAGLPRLFAGTFNSGSGAFDAPVNASAVVGQNFTYSIHASRVTGSLLVRADSATPLPPWLRINGLELTGIPSASDMGTTDLTLSITAGDDGSRVNVNLQINVIEVGNIVTQRPLQITSSNSYAGSSVTYVGRPPYLAASPGPSNSFTMRFYYKTLDGFAWPGIANPPKTDAIVPYLRPPNSSDDPASKETASLDIVYRPIWPYAEGKLGKMRLGDTLLGPKLGLPAVRGQTSLEILYQQSIAGNLSRTNVSAVLHDPTREKFTVWSQDSLPAGIRTDSFQGRIFFPALPPHLVERIFFDPSRGEKGHLVFRGEHRDQPLGEEYVLLNVLRGSDLAAVKALCPRGDNAKGAWDSAVDALGAKVETFRGDLAAAPGTFRADPALDRFIGAGQLAEITDDDTAVDSYALSASGPGQGYITLIAGNGWAFTPPAEPVALHIIKVSSPLYRGELSVIAANNPLNEQLTLQHTADLAGRFSDYEYEWRISPPVDGVPPQITPGMDQWTSLVSGSDLPRFTIGGSGIQALSDNYVVMRYRPTNSLHPLFNQWSDWTVPQLAEGWIKRVLAGINPFNQRVNDLFNNRVNTDASILAQAGGRWEGDVALNLENINNFGLIEIYETVLRRGKSLSIDSGINYGPANDALLLAAGYLNNLYMMLGNEAWADAANPTIGIGTKDQTYGDIATALFAFKGQVPSLLEEELALLRGRDDFLQPGVQIGPVYNRLVWNYTRGIDAGEAVYAINYNIQENNDTGVDGVINAADAEKMFPQGHGDAYGHYLTALKGYYSLLLDSDFDWVPRTEAVQVLGKPVQVDYLDERKFAAAAAAVARAGRQVFDLTWRRDYSPASPGWEHFAESRDNTRSTPVTTRRWGMDHWASRAGQGTYVNWLVGNAILPDRDPDPNHEGIQVIDRTTVPELSELVSIGTDLQTALDNAEGKLSPLGLPEGGIAFDINPSKITGPDPATHFEQIYERATLALKNAVASFDDAKDVTRLMRSEQDSLADFQAKNAQQELAYQNALIELYGTPYPDDIGPGRTYVQGYTGPDLIHYSYIDLPEIVFGDQWNYTEQVSFRIDLQDVPANWVTQLHTNFNFIVKADSPAYTNDHYIVHNLGPLGFHGAPANWASKRVSPGKIQQGISEYITAYRRLRQALFDNVGGKADLDKAIRLFESQKATLEAVSSNEFSILNLQNEIEDVDSNYQVASKWMQMGISFTDMIKDMFVDAVPDHFIFGLANGGNFAKAARVPVLKLAFALKTFLLIADAGEFKAAQNTLQSRRDEIVTKTKAIANSQLDQTLKESVYQIFKEMENIQAALETINQRLRELDDAGRNLEMLKAQGSRIQAERETFRRRAAAVVQGFRTRDAAFRIFRNEKLERYKALFDLSARYAFLAATAYDYETGLLHTQHGKEFVGRILKARALGVVRQGEPQFAGSNVGDPGLSSALAEMKADWDVLKGRLGFNNPDAYGTTVSLRGEQLRILPGPDGDDDWSDILHRDRKANLMEDADVARYCMQLSPKDGLPVPGLVLEFSTTISDKLNLFGQDLASGDHRFSPSSFATKIFAVGVAFEGYKGMDNPSANSSAVNFAGATSPPEPGSSFLDPDGLAATPYVYLVPVGVDSMRSPPLGDASTVRSWDVDDVTVPLPFNIGGSDLSTLKLWQSSASLTEELFSHRKHQAFRPVSSTAAFSQNIYGATGQLAPSQFTNRRLVGRSVWNSKWKLVIPGHNLLNDPDEGLERFLRTVKDVKLHFVTYSYAGN